MGIFAAPDVSQEEMAICVVSRDGALVAEAKVPTCPEAISNWLSERAIGLELVGLETAPLAIWLWNALTAKGVPAVCIDARPANGVLKLMQNKTDRHDARSLAQIMRTGWFKVVQVKSHASCVTRWPRRSSAAHFSMISWSGRDRRLIRTPRNTSNGLPFWPGIRMPILPGQRQCRCMQNIERRYAARMDAWTQKRLLDPDRRKAHRQAARAVRPHIWVVKE